MAVNDLLDLLPDEASVERHFRTTATSTGKAPAMIIARDVSPDDYAALLDRLDRQDEPPSYVRELELDTEGSLQIAEMPRSVWHELVAEEIKHQMPAALVRVGLPERAIESTGAALVSSAPGAPDGDWFPNWSEQDEEEIMRRWPRDRLSRLDAGTLLIEVAFSEMTDHVERKSEQTWMSDSRIFPLLVLSVDYCKVASENAILEGAPVELHVKLYRRRILDHQPGFEILKNAVLTEPNCIEPGTADCIIQLPGRELLYGLSNVNQNVTVELDLFHVFQRIRKTRVRLTTK